MKNRRTTNLGMTAFAVLASCVLSTTQAAEILVDSSILDRASVRADCPDGTVGCADDQIDIAVENELDQAPAIELVKTATPNFGGDSTLDFGETITYTLELKNTGNVELTDVTIDDVIKDLNDQPLELTTEPTYKSSDNINTTFPGVRTITVGETVTYEAVFAINQQAINAGGVTNTASATAVSPKGESIAVTSNEVETTIASAPAIEVIKTAT